MAPNGDIVTGTGQATFIANITEGSLTAGEYRCGIVDDVCGVLGRRIEVGVYRKFCTYMSS